ncbi:MAG TPA: hemolysin family protein [Xanthobacteraceae bacterium]|jgi:CBS domain containing-hemolysin-like protein|nr:hemolysin family protein [Xanthobacteraceae bacterium]
MATPSSTPQAGSAADSSATSAPGGPDEIRNLPAVIPPRVNPRERGEDWLGRVMRALFGWKPGSLRADLEVVLADGATSESGFSPEERTMLSNILKLRGSRVEDVMMPRADIIAVNKDVSLGELVKVFKDAAHSRLVVYDDTLDDSIGMVHIRDLIAFMTTHAVAPDAPPHDATAPVESQKTFAAGLDLSRIDLSMPLAKTDIVRNMLFVPPSMPAVDLLAKMQATHVHLALVIDEYGGTDGLVSIEDLVEMIVGDISDEHDEEEPSTITRQADGAFLADARTELEEVASVIGPDFDVGDAAEDADTLGGYLVMKAGHLPVRGELVRGPLGFEIEVLDSDPRRVKRVRIFRSKRADWVREERSRGQERSDERAPAPPGESAEARDAAAAGEASGKGTEKTGPDKIEAGKPEVGKTEAGKTESEKTEIGTAGGGATAPERDGAA